MDENDTNRRSIRVALGQVQRDWLKKQPNEGAAIRQAIWLLMATEARIEEESSTGARPDNEQTITDAEAEQSRRQMEHKFYKTFPG